MQMMQQFTGINFIFYFGTVFFTSLGTIKNPFLITLIISLINVCSTPIAFWVIERFGRRPMLIYGAAGMVATQLIVGIVGATAGKPGNQNDSATAAMIAFICLDIAFFAITWGPAAWVVIGEAFPLTIRSRGIALSTSSNWLWNCVCIPKFHSFCIQYTLPLTISSRLLASLPPTLSALDPATQTLAPMSSSCGAACVASPSLLLTFSSPKLRA
jgi:MFS family permease